jgi:hypothetical protein
MQVSIIVFFSSEKVLNFNRARGKDFYMETEIQLKDKDVFPEEDVIRQKFEKI